MIATLSFSPTVYNPHGRGTGGVSNQTPAAAPSADQLNSNSGMGSIVRAMQRPDSGLEVRDRLWLKITIKNAFIGADVVDWLYDKVSEGANQACHK